MEVMLHTLGYADDIALLEEGDAIGVNRLSERVTDISKGSKKEADMSIFAHPKDHDPACLQTGQRSRRQPRRKQRNYVDLNVHT